VFGFPPGQMQPNHVKKSWHKVAAPRRCLKSLILSSTMHKVSRLHRGEGCGLMHDYPWYFLFSSGGYLCSAGRLSAPPPQLPMFSFMQMAEVPDSGQQIPFQVWHASALCTGAMMPIAPLCFGSTFIQLIVTTPPHQDVVKKKHTKNGKALRYWVIRPV